MNVLLASSEEYRIDKTVAQAIINEVKDGMKRWKSIARRLGIPKREIDGFEQVYER